MNAQEIFLAAVKFTDPEQQAQYLDLVCGQDASLRQQVEELLRARQRRGKAQPNANPPSPAGSVGNAVPPVRTPQQGLPLEIPLEFLEPSTAPGSLGRLKHFEVQGVLGKGAFGIVLKAFDRKLHRIVAIKVMSPELASTSPARKRFLREARSAAVVRQENVVSIYAVEDEPIPFLVMEFIDGITLQEKIDRTGPLDLHEIVSIGKQVASGLEAAHAKGLIHRDIKPANILLEEGTGRAILTDFGLARATDDASLTQSGFIAGTPLYMSPEQAKGQRLDSRSDLFSLGSVLYMMCSGRPPFRAPSTIAVIRRVVEDQPRPIQEIITETPDWLVQIVERLHAKNPQERFVSAARVAEILKRCEDRLQRGKRIRFHSRNAEQTPAEVSESSLIQEQSSPRVPVWREWWQRYQQIKSRAWLVPLMLFVLLLVGVSLGEASGVTQFRSTMIRLLTSTGTLVVELDDPEVKVWIAEQELVFHGPGVQEIRLKPGQYPLRTGKADQIWEQELITVSRNGKQVIRVRHEPPKTAHATENSGDPAPEVEEDFRFNAHTRWAGTRTYTQGAFSPATVSYFMIVNEASEADFKGRIYHNGSYRNGTDVVGTIEGDRCSWIEERNGHIVAVQGRLQKGRLQMQFNGKLPTGQTTQGTGELQPRRELKQISSEERIKYRIPAHVSGGDWAGRYRLENDELIQERYALSSVLAIGDDEWHDYDLSLETMTMEGIQGTDIQFRSGGADGEYRLILGIENKPVELWRHKENQGHVHLAERVHLNHQKNVWYKIDIKLRGPNIQVLIDDQEIFNVNDEHHRKGYVGLLTYYSRIKWRNLKVTTPEGEILWEGFPEIPIEKRAPPRDPAGDRKAAEWVWSAGGQVKFDQQPQLIMKPKALPDNPRLNLTEISLAGNPKANTELVLQHLSDTVHLRKVNLNNNPTITDRALAALAKNTNLQELHAMNTSITGSGLYHLQECRELKIVHLTGAPVYPQSLGFLTHCHQIESVWIADTPTMTSEVMNYLSPKSNLNRLSVRNTPFDDVGMVALKKYKKLREIDLSGTKITDVGMSELSECAFEVLFLHNTSIGDQGLLALQNMKSLKRLGLMETKVTSDGMEFIRKALPNCYAYNVHPTK